MTPDEELKILRADWAALVAQVTGAESRRAAEADAARKLAAFPDLLEALRRFRHARDHWAEHGVFPPEYGIEADQCYDDWVADIADTILTKLEGGAA